MATHSSILTWRTLWTGEPAELLSVGSHRVRHDWSDLAAAAFITLCFFQLVPSFSWPHLPRSCFSFHTWDKEAFPSTLLDYFGPLWPTSHFCSPERFQSGPLSTLPLSFSSSCAHACATWERWDSRRGEIPASQLISSSGPRPTLRFLPAPGGICRCLCSASGIGGLHGRALSSPGWGRGSWCRHC